MARKIFHALYLVAFLCSVAAAALGQSPLQTLRGTARDRDTKQVLTGVSVRVEGTNLGAVSDTNGVFTIPSVPVGRVRVSAQLMGYAPYLSEDVLLLSAKTLVLDIELAPGGVALGETLVTAHTNAFEPVNELSVVSARAITVEETDRVAAAVNDPGRAALSYSGVQKGEDETENQIVVRGNAPTGILWRLEGIDIPNPNHFALIGSSGGGITAFSAQLLSRSDFLTGGMPAEYGNALSGVFDVRFRHGNDQRREYRAKIGILGIDFATEGPIQKGRASYLVNYRYSTLGLLNSLGFNLVGERVSNGFQDLSFNLAFKSRDQRRTITVFGFGGASEEHYYPVEAPEERDPAIPDHWNDRLKPAKVGVLGSTCTWQLSGQSYLKAVVAFTGNDIRRISDTLDRSDVRFRYENQHFRDGRAVANLTYYKAFSHRLNIKTGLIAQQVFFDFFKQSFPRYIGDPLPVDGRVYVQGQGNTRQFQQYAQVQWHLAPRWTVQAGWHAMFLAANKRLAADPRFSAQFRPNERHRLSLAAGLYRKTMPLMAYYVRDSLGKFLHQDLPFLQSAHFIGAWNWYALPGMRFTLEAYFQSLGKVPISPDPSERYWMLNFSEGFPEFPVVAKGKGQNYGGEAALEQRFRKKWFFLLNGSLYRARFRLAEGPWYAARFDSRFSSAVTIGREFALSPRDVLQIGGRWLLSGGFRYTPHDPVLSALYNRYIPLESAVNEGQHSAYRRLDARVAWRFNRRHTSGSLSLDIQNALNRANAYRVLYDPTNRLVFEDFRGELVPVLAFQIDF